MKRIAILMVTALMSLAAAAAPIRYFTQSQATRTVRHLNAQNEMMIYCGYDYEIETYVLINEVWAERVNSAYYELWVYGYDAYTGEEIYMPLDLSCVWLYSAGRMYSAAQYLRFHASVHTPSFTWYVPAYHPYTRVMHRPGYARTYHYDVHCYGWMPPAPPHGGYGPGMPPPMHPYYMRDPHAPAPRPAEPWTPGVDRPRVSVPDASHRTDSPRTAGSTRPSAQPSGSGTRASGGSTDGTRASGTAAGSRGGASTGTRAEGGSSSNTRGSGTTSGGRGSATTGEGSSRGSGTSAGSNTRGGESSGVSRSTTPSSSSVRSGSSSGSRGESTAAGNRGSETKASGSRSSETKATGSRSSETKATGSRSSETRSASGTRATGSSNTSRGTGSRSTDSRSGGRR